MLCTPSPHLLPNAPLPAKPKLIRISSAAVLSQAIFLNARAQYQSGQAFPRARSVAYEAIKFSKHPRDRMKIRNAKIRRTAYAACKRLRARELLQIVYRSARLRTLLERHATVDCFENDVERFKLKRVVQPDEIEQEHLARHPSLRLMSGRELRIETLVASSSFKDVYRCARECLGLKPNADSRSLRLTYIGNRLPHKECEGEYGEEIPCNDYLAYRRLRGVIMEAIIHK